MSNKPTIQLLRGTSSKRASSSVTLLPGQPFYEFDTNLLYIGGQSGTAIKSAQPVRALLDSDGNNIKNTYATKTELNTVKNTYATNTALNSVSSDLTAVKQTYALKTDIPHVPTLQEILGSSPIGDDTHHVYWDGTQFVSRPTPVVTNDDWYVMELKSQKIRSGQSTPEAEGLYVGQEYVVTLSTGEELTFVILGFNHDDLQDGTGKAGITFGMKNLMATTYSIPFDYPDYDWSSSYFKGTILTDVYYSLPETLRNVIKQVSKPYLNSSDKTKYSPDYLFLFSAKEVGSRYASSTPVGTTYEYYSNKSDYSHLKKYLHDGKGAASPWWSRQSLNGWNDTIKIGYYFALNSYTLTDGLMEQCHISSSDDADLNFKAGICFGFCI